MEEPSKVDDDSVVTEVTLTSNTSFTSPSKIDSYSKVETSEESASLQSKPVTIPIIHKENFFRIGNTYAFFPDKDGNPRIIIGPNCIYNIITIYRLLLYWSHINNISFLFPFLLLSWFLCLFFCYLYRYRSLLFLFICL